MEQYVALSRENQAPGMVKPPVANIRAIRILLAIVAFYDYEIWQMNVKTDFLNGHPSEDHASRSWNKRFDVEIKKIGFTQNPDEPCVYLKASGRYVFVLNGEAVDWKSAKQSTTVMSSIEAEYIAAVEASMEAVWMRKFIDGLGGVVPSNKRPMEMLCDNEPEIAMVNDPKVHIDDNVADPFTKPMSFDKHYEYARMVDGIVISFPQ
ncbi:hypothetical protein Tco_0323517 [Tanacetum coccineum]